MSVIPLSMSVAVPAAGEHPGPVPPGIAPIALLLPGASGDLGWLAGGRLSTRRPQTPFVPAPQPSGPQSPAAPRHQAHTLHHGSRDADPHAEIEVLTGLLEEADALHAKLAATLEAAQRRSTALEQDATAARAELTAEQADHIRTREWAEALQLEVKRLQRTLAAGGRIADAYQAAELAAGEAVSGPPRSFAELFDGQAEFPHIVFPHDRSPALRLDRNPKRSVWAAKAWSALRSLEDYAVAAAGGAFRGSFYTFCQQPPDGARPYPLKQVAMTESDQTMVRWPDQRRFPVPVDVCANGFVDMVAHLRLDNGGVAPRIHFHDATASHQRIFVGYVGQHLVNTRT